MAAIHDLLAQVQDEALRTRLEQEINRLSKTKKFGLVFEEHLPECTPLYDIPVRKGSTVAKKTGTVSEMYEVDFIKEGIATCYNKVTEEKEEIPVEELVSVAQFGEPIYPYLKLIDSVCNAPDSDLWHILIEADNYHALQLLEYIYASQVDCIYIDPPYNTGAKDWKYNNDYVDATDSYKHSKWLSMMAKRLKLAKKLLNPKDSVLIVTIDEKEYLHLGVLLEELFPEARMQMVSTVINSAGVTRGDEFSRSNEYIYFIKFGTSSPCNLPLPEEWRGHTKTEKKEALVWNQLMRSGTGARRIDRPNMFYPLFINEEGNKIVKIGDALPLDVDRNTVLPIPGTQVVWPIRSNGEEGRWRIGRDNLISIYEKGYVRLGSFTDKGMAITYLANGEQKKVEDGFFKIIGKREDGSLIEGEMEKERTFIPGTQWDIPSHNATYFGSQLLNKIIGEKRFDFPKSLYAVQDTLRFFVADKPNAIIVDFFAGSGTTLHAVNCLNDEDGGRRKCIMITNNEVSEREEKELLSLGNKPGDKEWEELGVARYVTWPRTVCSIKGEDVLGKPLKGNYLNTNKPLELGFKANAIFFKMGFLDKTAVALGRQLNELFPVLWLKAGAHGICPKFEVKKEHMQILPKNRFAILLDEKYFQEFDSEVQKYPEIQTIYIVTDSEAGFREMASFFARAETYQLYRDYLDNFRINVRS